MTFFGYAISDLTQSWLLYQGILFVLVMMFMPEGLAGLLRAASQLRRRVALARLVPVLLACLAAATLLAAGTAFLVELLQRLFSQDYRALASANAGAPWPPIPLFGRAWSPTAVSTWLVPAALLAAGAALVLAARRGAAAAQDAGEPGVPEQAPLAPPSGSAA
jgi:branched-chain amino acid transport system permease protein